MKIINVSLFVLMLFFISCGGGKKEHLIPVETFKVEKILIDLSTPPYPDSSVTSIMSGVGLCDIELSTSKNDTLKLPLCDPKTFRVFMNRKDGIWKNGFLVEVKAGVYSHEYRVINIGVINERLKVTNDYAGELLEMRTTPSGYYDLIIRYQDGVVGTVAMLHQWKENHYEPVKVVELNDHFVKPEHQDSINKVYLNNFVWGF